MAPHFTTDMAWLQHVPRFWPRVPIGWPKASALQIAPLVNPTATMDAPGRSVPTRPQNNDPAVPAQWNFP